MTTKLKDFIRSIRACKTSAEERAVVAKECALIRTSFKEGDNAHRQRNLAKLLFINMMGHPTHFGSMECLKLIASGRFCEKRMGYLGLMQLTDRESELLMLVINSMKNDISHPSQYVTGLALAALGTVGTTEICITLAKELEELCNSANPYIRKKALLCAIRFLQQAEDTIQRFVPVLPSVFEEKNHGVLLAGCALLEAIVEADPSLKTQLQNTVLPSVLNCVKRAVISSNIGASGDYEAGGITDPFLQVGLVRSLRVLGEGCPQIPILEEVQEVLCQVINTIDSTRAAGNAVLFEAAMSLIAVSGTNSKFQDIASGVLGRFLRNGRDSNIRYVALAALQRLVAVEGIVAPEEINDCLQDADLSIKRAAADVLTRAATAGSIVSLFDKVTDVLSTVARPSKGVVTKNVEAREFCRDITAKLFECIDRYSPTRRWQVDASIKLMVLALHSSDVSQNNRNGLIHLIGATPELQRYATMQLYMAACDNMGAEALVSVAVWCIGEYADFLIESGPIGKSTDLLIESAPVGKNTDLLIESGPIGRSTDLLIESGPVGKTTDLLIESGPSGNNISGSAPHVPALSPGLIMSFFERLMRGSAQLSPTSSGEASSPIVGRNQLLEAPSLGSGVREAVIVSLAKLSVRLPSELPRIRKLIAHYNQDSSAELQQRAAEYETLLSEEWNDVRPSILDRIPMPAFRGPTPV